VISTSETTGQLGSCSTGASTPNPKLLSAFAWATADNPVTASALANRQVGASERSLNHSGKTRGLWVHDHGFPGRKPIRFLDAGGGIMSSLIA
jgi:hypothetical protein